MIHLWQALTALMDATSARAFETGIVVITAAATSEVVRMVQKTIALPHTQAGHGLPVFVR